MDRARSRAVRSYLIATTFLSGFSVMVLEMAAFRAVAPYFGASTYTWTNVIGVILGALSAGYFFGGRLADKHPRAVVLYGVILVGGLLCLITPLVVKPVALLLLPPELGLEGAVEPVYRASLVATLILFAPPVLVLGAVSPFAIKLLATPDRVGGASGHVFAASTVGSIVGTFLTTLTLLPWLGTRLTIGLAGGTLMATAVVGFAICALSRRTAGVGFGGAAAAVLLLLATGAAGPIKDDPGQLAEVESAYQYLRVVDRVVDRPGRAGGTVRMLQINEAEQAYQSVEVKGSALTGGRYYDYYSVLPLLIDRDKLDVLVIGLAGGTIPAQLRHFYPQGLHVTGVEIDPAVLDLGRRYFSLRDSSWLTQKVADGRVFLKTSPKRPDYDLVIIDAFAQEYYIPFHLATKETFAEIRDRLRPGGIVALNAAAYRPDSPLLSALVGTVREAFDRVYRVPVDGYPNYMIFAMKDADPDFSRLLALPTRGPEDWEQLRRLAKYVGNSAAAARPAVDGLVLSDDRSPVERLIDADVRRESRALLGRAR